MTWLLIVSVILALAGNTLFFLGLPDGRVWRMINGGVLLIVSTAAIWYLYLTGLAAAWSYAVSFTILIAVGLLGIVIAVMLSRRDGISQAL